MNTESAGYWRVGRTAICICAIAAMCVVPLTAGAGVSGGTTERVSLDLNGTQANGGSLGVAISPDGRYVAFNSAATNLVPGDTNSKDDIFLVDRATGDIDRVSVPTGIGQSDDDSFAPLVSNNGRHVFFESGATNLVPGDTNGSTDVFMHDRVMGTTTRVSEGLLGIQGNGSSYSSQISSDGRYLVFASWASNLVSGDTNGLADVFLRDLETGSIKRVSIGPLSQQGTGNSQACAVSDDGRYVAFSSGATEMHPADTNGWTDVFVRDMVVGDNEIVSVSSGGIQGDDSSRYVDISADGRVVAFESSASNLVPGDTNGSSDYFVRDRKLGTTKRVSVDSNGNEAYGDHLNLPKISGNGRFVAFNSYSDVLVAGDTNSSTDSFVHDLNDSSTTRISVASDGTQGNGSSYTPHPSADGRRIAYNSTADNLVFGDSNGARDIFVYTMPFDLVRVAGSTRYETTIEASKRAFPDGAGYVVIATGTNWPDALGGSALAGAAHAPLLLTRPDTLPASVKAEITRLGAADAFILGGTGAVSAAVESELATLLGGAVHVQRLDGADRYATAKKIADTLLMLESRFDGTVFVATGANYPDALAASPLSAARAIPILLARPGAVDVYLPPLATDAVILGGTGAVSSQIETFVETALGPANVSRIGGATRYETAVEIAEHGVMKEGLYWSGFGIATGTNFPDALAGGAMLGSMESVMLLTPTGSLAGQTEGALSSNKFSIGHGHILGGTGAVSDSVMGEVEAAVQ